MRSVGKLKEMKLARRGGSYQYEKRQKELKKTKRKKEKQERRKAAKEAEDGVEDGEEPVDPDLEGMVAGPQPVEDDSTE